MRTLYRVKCSCGGEVANVLPSQTERNEAGCPKPCCLTILECRSCRVRFAIEEESPDPDYGD